MSKQVLHSRNVGKTVYTLYKQDGSSKYNVDKNGKFQRRFDTYGEAMFFIDNKLGN